MEDDFAAQRDTIIDGTALKVTHKTVPQLTSTIRDEGLIMVYMRYNNTDYALPYQNLFGGTLNTTDFHVRVQHIYITLFNHDNSSPSRIRGLFRFVIIPGGVPAAKMKRPDGFWDDYEAVAEYYGIPD